MKTSDLLKYRNVWLGLAMIGIVWYHSAYEFSLGFVNGIKPYVYGGVDICLFASGIGCYFSLNKDPDPYRFIRRRFSRIFPMYLCFMALWIPFMALTDEMTPAVALGNLFAVQSFTGLGHDFNWYICATLLFYFFAPYMKSAVDNTRSHFSPFLLLAALLLITIPFWGSTAYIIFIVRIPIFYIGILFGRLCATRIALSRRSLLVLFLISIAGMLGLTQCVTYCHHHDASSLLWEYGLYWYPFILITPGFCAAVSFLSQQLSRNKYSKLLLLPLEKIGQYSYEVCLMHILVFDALEYLHLYNYRPKVFYFSIPCMAVGCVLLRFAVRFLQKLTKKQAV